MKILVYRKLEDGEVEKRSSLRTLAIIYLSKDVFVLEGRLSVLDSHIANTRM